MVAKGLAWIVLGAVAITVIVLLAFKAVHDQEDVWCDESLNAGHCEIYKPEEDSSTCFCIDLMSQDSNEAAGVHERAVAQCSILNGSLTVAEDSELVLWLAKRMYSIGVGQAMVSLQRIDGSWFWMTERGKTSAGDLNWRSENDFLPNPEHTNAAINVETVEVEVTDVADGLDYVYYNYDFYLNGHSDYKWYGFTTIGNEIQSFEKIFLICNYVSQPAISVSDALETISLKQTSEPTTPDPCTCPDEAIMLENLEDSRTIQSPRYPSNYCSDLNCLWTVRTTEGLIVKLEWLVFKTEDTFDFVYIYDGDTTTGRSPLLEDCTGIGCGDHRSTGALLQIHFSSDHVTTELGFKARVTAIDAETTDYVYIYGHGNTTVPNSETADHVCSGNECQNLRISGYKLGSIVDIHFISNQHSSSTARHFKGKVTVSKKYCEVDDLRMTPPWGSISYSDQLSDGNIPLMATATLTCPQNTKINGAFERRDDLATCLEIATWDKTDFDVCVPVCPVTYMKQATPDSGLYVCKLSVNSDLNFTQSQNSISVEYFDHNDDKIEAELFTTTCLNSSIWSPKPPTCHTTMSGILLIEYGEYESNFEFYSPIEGTIKQLNLSFTPSHHNKHVSFMLPDGRILVATGYDSDDEPYTTNYIVNVFTGEVEIAANLIADRTKASGAALNGVLYICGGFRNWNEHRYTGAWVGRGPTNTCESYHDDAWHEDVSNMTLQREGLALVALGPHLYAIGGIREVDYYCGSEPDWKVQIVYACEKEQFEMAHTVEKFSVDLNEWELVASMNLKRAFLAASVLDALIYACGGDNYEVLHETCERYDPGKNQWQLLNSLVHDRHEFMMVTYHGKLYAMGGIHVNNGATIESYDKDLDLWSLEKPELKKLDSSYIRGSAIVTYDF